MYDHSYNPSSDTQSGAVSVYLGARRRTRRRFLDGRLSLGYPRRCEVAQKLREEAGALEEQMRAENRLSAQRYHGEAVGLRKAVPLVLMPNLSPFKRLEPWEIAEKLTAEAGVLESRMKYADRLGAQWLYGEAVGLRRAAAMIELIFE